MKSQRVLLELSIECDRVPGGLKDLLGRTADVCAQLEGIEKVQVYVRLIDAQTMRDLNRDTRGIDRVTDVLSYPSIEYQQGTARQHKKELRRELDPETGHMFLGEMAICVDRASEQALEYGHSLAREIGFLTAHSMFHLMGYDHIEEGDYKAMRAMETKAMGMLSLSREGSDITDQQLMDLAIEALGSAYAPYSQYKVGACLLSEDGRIFQGCNVENASYGATICAERSAVCAGVQAGVRRFVAIAVAGEHGEAAPCGICRQVLNEFSADMRVILGAPGKGLRVTTLNELLPEAFGPDSLSKDVND